MCVRVQFTRGTVQSQHFYFDRNNFFLLQRIKNTLYYAIFTPYGRYQPDEQIPPVRQLAMEASVNPNTM